MLYALQPAPRNRRRTGDEDEDEGDSPRASITITMRLLPSAALAPSNEYEDNGRKYWMRDARHRTGKRSIIHNGCISFKSCESVKAHRVPGRPAAFADALSRLNFARFTGCAIERDFSAGVREGEGFHVRKDEKCDRGGQKLAGNHGQDVAIKPYIDLSGGRHVYSASGIRIYSCLPKCRLMALNPFHEFWTDSFPLAQIRITINAILCTLVNPLISFASLQMR